MVLVISNTSCYTLDNNPGGMSPDVVIIDFGALTLIAFTCFADCFCKWLWHQALLRQHLKPSPFPPARQKVSNLSRTIGFESVIWRASKPSLRSSLGSANRLSKRRPTRLPSSAAWWFAAQLKCMTRSSARGMVAFGESVDRFGWPRWWIGRHYDC